ncbi:MAG: hypothetical protein IJI37_05960, partial [Opitutales bacterium]|nr:hypothetical protein [Opitutales bacterium]
PQMAGNTEKPFDILALEKFMRERGYTRKDLELQVGTRARVSEVLSGRRQLSVSMLKNLVNNWGIDANLLLRDPSARHSKAKPSNPREGQPPQPAKSADSSILWMLD